MSSGDGPGDMIDQLDWTISNGDVKSMYLNEEHSSLIIHTETTDDGELFVGLNADYIGSDDGSFVILVDNQEHEDYEQAGMDLYISLPAGAETVEIIGSYAVPEFGTIAMIVLAVAIVSIIAISAKSRMTLIPKL
jgi:predicted secreted protein with PEFG-CTERM motif